MNVFDAVMRTSTITLKVPSETSPEFIDITDEVEGFIESSGVLNGIVVVFSKHTTAAIVIQEDEPLLLDDFRNLLDSIASSDAKYSHNDFDVRTVHMHDNECPNGHSHCQHLTLGSSESIPVIDGEMALGEWQRVFMVELDGEKAQQIGYREVVVQALGQT
ncbi:MAG: secondary thiamine-phosphate synthase enzyme YjbQ [Chloroflexota bacterium]|nr:secondary thiamine-phosphate synthase enzyme YjbQ [Chloroflexota bacterium]MED5449736.1 secondary thiamine-phosphate synthase enzyme YjbQ [Chloroflexota bacterium]|tara:strand:- start:645 stop:1127 length:483 start_codon:yes stop_codon:yes gene_type:complete